MSLVFLIRVRLPLPSRQQEKDGRQNDEAESHAEDGVPVGNHVPALVNAEFADPVVAGQEDDGDDHCQHRHYHVGKGVLLRRQDGFPVFAPVEADHTQRDHDKFKEPHRGTDDDNGRQVVLEGHRDSHRQQEGNRKGNQREVEFSPPGDELGNLVFVCHRFQHPGSVERCRYVDAKH